MVVRPRCAKCGDPLPFVRHLQGFTKCEAHTILVPKKFGGYTPEGVVTA